MEALAQIKTNKSSKHCLSITIEIPVVTDDYPVCYPVLFLNIENTRCLFSEFVLFCIFLKRNI